MLGLGIKTFSGRSALWILGENPFFICFVLGRAPSSSRYTHPMGPAVLSHRFHIHARLLSRTNPNTFCALNPAANLLCLSSNHHFKAEVFHFHSGSVTKIEQKIMIVFKLVSQTHNHRDKQSTDTTMVLLLFMEIVP